MAAKRASTKRKSKTAAKAKPARRARYGVSIRMYRLGVGDCFLLTVPRRRGAPYRMLIDCGVHQSQEGGRDRIVRVAEHIRDDTGKELDVIVATHEHWDHLSGFSQAEAVFGAFKVGELWCAWTEKAGDPLADSLIAKRRKSLALLGVAHARLRLAGREDADNPLSGLLGFFGDTSGRNLQKAAEVLRRLGGANIRYREPGEPPIELPDGQGRVFVLGPPRNREAIGRSEPRKGSGEVYLHGAAERGLDVLRPALTAESPAPFDARYAIPLPVTRTMAFFQDHYWADRSIEAPREREDPTQDWRRIDEDWLGAATNLALKLDEDTNNTSLVLAIELGPKDKDGPVLLFAADAQVGNWLSWKDVSWTYEGRKISGHDLLRRTILYKVGHHASHNATLRENGLELMDALKVALVPTDSAMAKKVGWGTLPWPKLLTALGEKAQDCVIRSDRPKPAETGSYEVVETDLFYEVRI